MRIATWNLWWRFGPDWRTRQPLLLDTLRFVDADVVALQEVWGDDTTTQAHEFATLLGLHASFVGTSLPAPPDPPEHPEQAGIAIGLGLLSRWPITDVQIVPLTSTHRNPGELVSLVTTIGHPDGPLHVVATCLEWSRPFLRDRLVQAEEVAALAADRDLDGPHPVFVAGDLNAPPDSDAFSALNDVLHDTWVLGGGDPSAVTFSSVHPQATTNEPHLIDRRIDHVLVRPGRRGQTVTVERAVVAGDVAVEGVYPSDHWAVVCDVTWSG